MLALLTEKYFVLKVGGGGGVDKIGVVMKYRFLLFKGAPVAQWVKRWPNDLADRVRSSLEVKSSQP